MTTANEAFKRYTPSRLTGRDEMNLAEFPFATLSRRDQRVAEERHRLSCEVKLPGSDGQYHTHKWTASGSVDVGLPNEFGERILIALMAITAQQGFQSRQVTFSVYQLLNILKGGTRKKDYLQVQKALKQLVGVTIYTNAFWDHKRKKRVTTSKGFHLIDTLWLQYQEEDQTVREEEGVPAYIVWGETIWKSFQDGYLKKLDLEFFYSLQSAIARRLYRLLDKKFHDRVVYERDIFELASRLGMARYGKPSWVKRKLQPGIDELVERGYLAGASGVKVRGYSRMKFVKASAAADLPQPADDVTGILAECPQKGTAGGEPELWEQVLRNLRLHLTAGTYEHFVNSRLLSLQGNQAVIGVVGRYACEWIKHRLVELVEETMSRLQDGQPVGVTIVDLSQGRGEVTVSTQWAPTCLKSNR